MVGMLSVLAELQRELIVANTNDGLPSARARGRVGGHRPKLTEDPAALAQPLSDQQEKTVKHIADMFGAPRSPVYGHPDKTKTVPRQPKTTALTKPWRSVSCTPLTRPCRADETVRRLTDPVVALFPGGRPLAPHPRRRPRRRTSPSPGSGRTVQPVDAGNAGDLPTPPCRPHSPGTTTSRRPAPQFRRNQPSHRPLHDSGSWDLASREIPGACLNSVEDRLAQRTCRRNPWPPRAACRYRSVPTQRHGTQYSLFTAVRRVFFHAATGGSPQ